MKTTRLLLISPDAGRMNDQIQAKLRRAFADHLIVEFDPSHDLAEMVTPLARIIVAGGDGTVEFVVRKFADSRHPVGVIPLGTYNNLARALKVPTDVDRAMKVARDGHTRTITLGRVNDRIFVEACAVGLFGETIALGDEAKDLEFGKLAAMLKKVIAARRFRYDLDGDIKGGGTAMSLVFSNTSTIGMQLPISEGTPMDPYLELSVQPGQSRSDILARAVKSAVLGRFEDSTIQVFRFSRLTVTTKPGMRVYADNFYVGRTPATITAEASALRMLVPR
jgi:diacylglycerol kinase (ATP)